MRGMDVGARTRTARYMNSNCISYLVTQQSVDEAVRLLLAGVHDHRNAQRRAWEVEN